MNANANDEMAVGLDFYDPETRVFPKIAEKAANGGSLTKREVLRILKWKLWRIKDVNAETVADARMIEINSAIAKAREAGSEVEALQDLEKVPGIRLATATAILTVCYPKVFTIIDVRVLEKLDLFPSTLSAEKRKIHSTEDWTAKNYFDEYLPKVRERSEAWCCTLRDADRALWGLSVRQRVDDIISKSERLSVHTVSQDSLSASQRVAFTAEVLSGGEVAPNGLSERISEAHRLAYATVGDQFVGVGAVKRPRESYKRKVADLSGYDVKGYTAELGWIYVRPEARGLGLGFRISEALCALHGGRIFATTRSDNDKMQRILSGVGFERKGTEYEASEHIGKKIQLWVLER